ADEGHAGIVIRPCGRVGSAQRAHRASRDRWTAVRRPGTLRGHSGPLHRQLVSRPETFAVASHDVLHLAEAVVIACLGAQPQYPVPSVHDAGACLEGGRSLLVVVLGGYLLPEVFAQLSQIPTRAVRGDIRLRGGHYILRMVG